MAPSVSTRRSATLGPIACAVGVVAACCAFGSLRTPASAFVGAGRAVVAGSSPIARCAEGETPAGLAEPPSDVDLQEKRTETGSGPRKYLKKSENPSKLQFVRRELKEEAERLRPYIEPLLKKQYSLREITFALNRQGSKLRHLLFRPRCGLPVFTEHKVRRLCRLAAPKPRMIQYVRPKQFPPRAVGAAYPEALGEVYAEVPPLKPWTPTRKQRKAATPKAEKAEKTEEAAPAAGGEEKKAEDLDELFG
eukprot:TRINITY_DN3056_c0_g1_i1.p2 TRINITY_DN3056_c0_g1~~TRINITY_DN3056_c0_g1_i1.p2  ORF type:complete len:250 (-),score=59.67 TRINITY_DN3056_c0_g1_i1:159-908(-)